MNSIMWTATSHLCEQLQYSFFLTCLKIQLHDYNIEQYIIR